MNKVEKEKLRLSKETLRNLTDHELERLYAGAGQAGAQTSACDTESKSVQIECQIWETYCPVYV